MVLWANAPSRLWPSTIAKCEASRSRSGCRPLSGRSSRHPGIRGRTEDLGEHRDRVPAVQSKKGARTPEEAGMKLRRAPRRPIAPPIFRMPLGIRKTPESWRDYVYWNVEVEDLCFAG